MSEGNGAGPGTNVRPVESLISRKTVRGPSGYDYVLRPLSVFQLQGALGTLVDLSALLADKDRLAERLEASPAEQRKVEAGMERVIRAGLVEPTLPEGAEVWALGADVLTIWNEILALSGWTAREAEGVRPFSETAASSSASTASPDATAGDHPSSPEPA